MYKKFDYEICTDSLKDFCIPVYTFVCHVFRRTLEHHSKFIKFFPIELPPQTFFPIHFELFNLFSHKITGRSQCSYPGDPANGFVAPLKFFYDPGDFLTVQCRPGFIEQGINGQPPERPKCLPDGNWSAQVPQCKSYEEV